MTEDEETGKYCKPSDVLALFDDISDTPNEALLNRVIKDAEAWIDTRLKRSHVPVPLVDEIPDSFETIAVYHAASDILMVLYHGEEYQTQRNYWFQSAEDLLEDYIDDYLENLASEEEKEELQMVSHSHAPTYSQRRHRGWVR